MQSERWKRLQELYHAAVEQPASERDSFVEAACRDDRELLAELRSLLGHEADAGRVVHDLVDEARGRVEDASWVGRRIDAYRIVSRLGAGGMGEVYLAHDTSLDREVAVKVLRPEQLGSAQSRERFRLEARTAASLTHPSIVPLHAFGEVDGGAYFVMGYVRGEALSRRLKREGALPVPDARRILTELGQALDYAHRQGVVHRDVKPDNVLIDERSGRAILTDFGIARPESRERSLTATGSVVGTPAYMSPEQASGQPGVDARSDIYSLGVLGYVLLSGRLPFEGETPSELLVQHMTRRPVPLAAVAPHVPQDVALAVDRCLAKDPRERWPDARGFAEAVARRVDDEDDLPRDLAGLSPAGFVISLALVVAAYARLFELCGGRGGALVDLLEGAVGIVMLPVAVIVVLAFRHRALGRVLFAAFRQPTWWPFWYPRRLRRSWDATDRLPSDLRHTRAALSAVAFAAVFVVVPLAIALRGVTDQYARTGRTPTALMPVVSALERVGIWVPPVFVALCAYAVVRVSRSASQYARRGVPDHDLVSLVLGSTSQRSFWALPHIALLLEPPPEGRAESWQTTAERVRAIASLAESLAGSLREVGELAAAAARRAQSVLSALDREMGRLVDDADEEEASRLKRKLQELGDPRAGESAERSQMRQLSRRQLELLQGVDARLEAARTRRSRLTALLAAMQRELVELHAAATSGSAGRPGGAERLRAQCSEIARIARLSEGDDPGETLATPASPR